MLAQTGPARGAYTAGGTRRAAHQLRGLEHVLVGLKSTSHCFQPDHDDCRKGAYNAVVSAVYGWMHGQMWPHRARARREGMPGHQASASACSSHTHRAISGVTTAARADDTLSIHFCALGSGSGRGRVRAQRTWRCLEQSVWCLGALPSPLRRPARRRQHPDPRRLADLVTPIQFLNYRTTLVNWYRCNHSRRQRRGRACTLQPSRLRTNG